MRINSDEYRTAEKLLDEGRRESNHHFHAQTAVQTIGNLYRKSGR